MYIRTRTITALNESQLNMWLANFKINGCPSILKLGALRVTVGRIDNAGKYTRQKDRRVKGQSSLRKSKIYTAANSTRGSLGGSY